MYEELSCLWVGRSLLMSTEFPFGNNASEDFVAWQASRPCVVVTCRQWGERSTDDAFLSWDGGEADI